MADTGSLKPGLPPGHARRRMIRNCDVFSQSKEQSKFKADFGMVDFFLQLFLFCPIDNEWKL
jgi:hypothetical protein